MLLFIVISVIGNTSEDVSIAVECLQIMISKRKRQVSVYIFSHFINSWLTTSVDSAPGIPHMRGRREGGYNKLFHQWSQNMLTIPPQNENSNQSLWRTSSPQKSLPPTP